MIRVYVPAQERGTIARGSAIVSTGDIELATGKILADFEGDIYGWGRTYAQCVHQAAGRHVERYPTVARRHFDPSELTEVGWFDDTFGEVHVNDLTSLESWLGREVGEGDLKVMDGKFVELRMVRDEWTPEQRHQLKFQPASIRRRFEQAGLI
jgi:hypothetical protein